MYKLKTCRAGNPNDEIVGPNNFRVSIDLYDPSEKDVVRALKELIKELNRLNAFTMGMQSH